MQKAFFNSPIGMLEIWDDEIGICSIDWVKSSACGPNDEIFKKHDAELKFGFVRAADDKGRDLRLSDLRKNLTLCTDELSAYFRGELESFSVKLSQNGTQFQKSVWSALLEIPYGEVMTYGELAAAIGRPRASRAVGSANGKNKIPIIVPCHRVVAAGGLGGYSGAGGVATKAWLLNFERENLAKFGK